MIEPKSAHAIDHDVLLSTARLINFKSSGFNPDGRN
jgi:hypothetical protein